MDPTPTSPPPPPEAESAVSPNPPPAFDPAKDVADNKDLAAFSYALVMSIIVYVLRRDSPFVRFHSKQAMVLFALAVILWFIPLIGPFLELIVLVGMLLGFANAAQGKWSDVPLAGPLSRGEMSLRQAWREIVDAVSRALHALKRAPRSDTKDSPPPTPPPSSSTP